MRSCMTNKTAVRLHLNTGKYDNLDHVCLLAKHRGDVGDCIIQNMENIF